ncbi:MAG: hypothetical protein ACOYMN_14380, partial [Roseimicrobium sp.]
FPLLLHRGALPLSVQDLSANRAPMLVGTFWNVDAVTARALGGVLWPVPVDFARRGLTFTPVGRAPISHYFFHENAADTQDSVCLASIEATDEGGKTAAVTVTLFALPDATVSAFEMACGEKGTPPAALAWAPATQSLTVRTAAEQLEVHLRRNTAPEKIYSSAFPVRRWFAPPCTVKSP